jgi:hypothetical protein
MENMKLFGLQKRLQQSILIPSPSGKINDKEGAHEHPAWGFFPSPGGKNQLA